MGRQFQLETIPRFQWRVIVEVCSGLAQTELDSTNFWVIEYDVRFGVKGAVLTVDQSLPVYPYQQTISDADGMSQRCHQRSAGMSPPGGGQVSVHFVALIDRRVLNAQRHLFRGAQWGRRRVQRRS
jgi:hypothetical protein